MANYEFAAVIAKLDRLVTQLSNADVEIANELLDATHDKAPRPAWNTGQLRNSGVAYIGSIPVGYTAGMTTFPNPNGAYAKYGKRGRAELGVLKSFGTLRKRGLDTGDADGEFGTTRGKITIVYTSPVAALMHEWTGKFSAPLAGANYISAKMATADIIAVKVLRKYL